MADIYRWNSEELPVLWGCGRTGLPAPGLPVPRFKMPVNPIAIHFVFPTVIWSFSISITPHHAHCFPQVWRFFSWTTVLSLGKMQKKRISTSAKTILYWFVNLKVLTQPLKCDKKFSQENWRSLPALVYSHLVVFMTCMLYVYFFFAWSKAWSRSRLSNFCSSSTT